jgi:hypothetical protein
MRSQNASAAFLRITALRVCADFQCHQPESGHRMGANNGFAVGSFAPEPSRGAGRLGPASSESGLKPN